ncbi:MAG: LPD38 domain-containing protein, partial [Dehalococcoidia bacterium]
PAIPESIRTVAEPRIGFRAEGGATASGPPGATPPDFPSAPRPSPEPPGSPRARIRERIVFESDKPKPTFRDRVTSRLHQLADYFDKTAPVARAERKATGSVSETGPTRTMEASQNRSAYDVESLWKRGTYRRFDADGNPIGEPIKFETPPSEIVKRVAEKGDMEDLSVYAVARRRQSRYTPSDIEAGFSPEDAAAFIDEIDRTKPHVKEAAEAISATYNVLWDALHDSGAISTKRWRASAGEFYVPMDRYFGPNKPAPGAVRGRNALSSPEIKGVKGGKQPIEDPVPKTFDRLRRMQEIVNRSRSGRKLIELRDAYPEAFDDIMREVGKGTKADFDFDTIIERQAERLRADGVPEPEIRDAARDLAIDEWADKFTGEHVVTHLPNGTKRVMQVLDEPMVNALSAGGSGLAKALNRVVESKAGRLLFQTVTKLKRLGITLDPAFSARQAIAADTTNAVMYDPGPMWRTPDRMLRGIFDASVSAINEWSRTVLNKGDLLPQTKAGRLYDESGAMHFAQGDRPVTAETAARPKTLFGKVARGAKKVGSGAANTLRLIQDAQQASMRRVAQYSLLSEWKKAGTWDGNVNSLTLDQMTQLNNAALRLGGSFRLGSNTSSAINKTIAFWKASERPFMDVFYWARKNKAKFARRSAVIAAPFIAEWMAYKDEDWYNDLPLWRRAGLNINKDVWFPIYNPAQVIGVAFREALRSAHEEGNTDGALVTAEAFSRSMPAIFQTFTDAATEYAENRETTRAVLKGIGGVTPDAAKGALEFATGVNTFTGRDINPMGSETLRKEAPEKVIDARIAPWVSDASRWLADLGVNITPNEIDHLTRAYGGTLGGTLTRRGSLLNRTFAPEGAPIPEPADDPLLGWMHRRIRESKEVSDFWNLYREFQGRRAATRVYERDQDADRLAEVGIDSIKELRPLLDQMRANNEQMAQAPVEEKRRLAKETREIARIGSYILREVMGLNEKPAPAFR